MEWYDISIKVCSLSNMVLRKPCAVQHGQEVLEMLMNSALQDGEPLPSPKTHAAA
jgi:hypothetical protein